MSREDNVLHIMMKLHTNYAEDILTVGDTDVYM